MPGIGQRGGVLRLYLCAISTALGSRTLLVAENLCPRRSLSHSPFLVSDGYSMALQSAVPPPALRSERTVENRPPAPISASPRKDRRPARARSRMQVRSSGRLLAIEQVRSAAVRRPTEAVDARHRSGAPSRLLAGRSHIAKELKDPISEVKTCDDRPTF
jgi:hypothetical protein